MIQLDSVFFNYNKDYNIFEAIDLKLEKGKIVGIFGSNGSGKSTFLNLISGVIKPDKGRIIINGKENNFSMISYFAFNSFYYPRIKGIELLDFYISVSKSNNEYVSKNIIEISKSINLPIFKFVDEYSDGMKQKLYLLATLIPEKGYYLFDEPLNFLDYKSCFFFLDIIKEYKLKNKTIIMSEHNLDFLINNSDEILFFDRKVELIKKISFSEFEKKIKI